MPAVPHPGSFVVLGLLGAVAVAVLFARRSVVRGSWTWALVVVTAGVMAGPLDRLAEERSLSLHVVQHMALFSVLPVLLLKAAPGLTAARREVSVRRSWALLTEGTLVVWIVHVPPVMDALVDRPVLNDVSHLGLIAAGVAMAWPLMAPSALAGMAAVAYVAVAEVAVGVLGMWLTWYPDVVYDAYVATNPLWGLDTKTDQSLAGALLLVVEEPFLAIEVAILFIAALRDPDEDEAATS